MFCIYLFDCSGHKCEINLNVQQVLAKRISWAPGLSLAVNLHYCLIPTLAGKSESILRHRPQWISNFYIFRI